MGLVSFIEKKIYLRGVTERPQVRDSSVCNNKNTIVFQMEYVSFYPITELLTQECNGIKAQSDGYL